MADFNGKGGRNRVLLVLGLVALTLAALAGIKFIMSDSSSETRPVAAEPRDIFSASEDDAPPPELNPLTRSENPGGGSLDMFSETNAGYYGEDEPAAPAAAPVARKKAAPAKPKTTAVPRMKMAPFKSITPTNMAPSGAGGRQSMPDLSEMMRKAQEQAGQTGSGD